MDKTFVSILAGLGGMVGWGTSDFLASSASEKIGHTKTFFWSQVAGIVLILVTMVVMKPALQISYLFFFLSIGAGIAYALGYLFFYKGFEIGNVSVVSACINLQTLFIIFLSYFVHGQRLTPMQIPAVVLLIIGVLLLSVNFADLQKGSITLLRGVRETILAAMMFGIFYWPLNEYIVERVNWLIVSIITKCTAVFFVFLITKLRKQSVQITTTSRRLLFLVAVVGLLEAFGVLSVTFGLSYGDGIIVAPISSALTIVTVGLAMIFSKERITRIQALGIVLVVSGIVMTAF